MRSAIGFRSSPLTQILSCLVSLTIVACLDSPASPGSEKTCESNCDRQAQAGCAKTAIDFPQTCKSACLVYRAAYATCVSTMDAMSACVDHKVAFTCEPNGTISANPVAVCLNEEYDCIDCTGDATACRN